MKLIKVEKDNCSACKIAGAYLDSTGVAYENYNIQGADAEQANAAREILGKVSMFTVPVTVVMAEDGSIVDYAKGADTAKLETLVELVK